jgi:hypothetical protein
MSLPLVALLFLSSRKDKLKFSDGDWVAGQPKPVFATSASALLAGIYWVKLRIHAQNWTTNLKT